MKRAAFLLSLCLAMYSRAQMRMPKRAHIPIVPVDGPARPGEWTKDFEGALNSAERDNAPLIIVLVADLDNSCGNCERLQTACNKPQFIRWVKRRQPYMVFGKRYFLKKAIPFVKIKEKRYKHGTPLCAVYWPKEDGSQERLAFSGVIGKMPAGVLSKTEPLTSQFIRSLDIVAGKYVGNPASGRMLALIAE